MSRFDNSTNYGAMFAVALIAAVVSSVATYAIAGGGDEKVAVIDLQRVVVASKDVVALKAERDAQIAELQKMADEANAEIGKIKNEEKKKEASEKYLAEINAKKAGYDKVYASALQASDQKLNDVIKSVADKEDATVVLNKAALVQGGVDITDSVVDLVK